MGRCIVCGELTSRKKFKFCNAHAQKLRHKPLEAVVKEYESEQDEHSSLFCYTCRAPAEYGNYCFECIKTATLRVRILRKQKLKLKSTYNTAQDYTIKHNRKDRKYPTPVAAHTKCKCGNPIKNVPQYLQGIPVFVCMECFESDVEIPRKRKANKKQPPAGAGGHQDEYGYVHKMFPQTR